MTAPVALPSPTVPARRPRPNGVLLLEEDFTDSDLLAKPLFTGDYMNYQSVGERGLLSSAYRGGVMPVLYAGPKPADFLMEYDYRAPAAAPGSAYGVVFRSDAAEGGLDYYYFIQVQPATDRVIFARWQNGEWSARQEGPLPPDLLNDDGFNRVRLEAVGSEFSLFINDTYALSASDDALKDGGALGLAIIPSDALAEGEEDLVYFDDIRIYSASPELAAAAAEPVSTATPSPTAALGASPSPSATARAQATPNATRHPEAGAATSWVRGDQPYGTYEYTTERFKEAPDARKLTYDFPAVAGNFVVFEARPNVAISGKPTSIVVWVYGDGSGHFLNAWLRDAKGERRSYSFGPIAHTGWQQMTAWLDDTRPWPNGHIDGPDNDVLDFPVSFNSLVLDGVPDGKASRGVIYLDELTSTNDPMPVATATPEAGAPPSESGSSPPLGFIAFPVFAPDRGTYDLYVLDLSCGCMDRVMDYASQPTISPDGTRLAFRRWKSDDRGVEVMDLYGGNQMRLTNFLEDALPVWSADARTLAFSSRREGDRKSRLYEVRTDGGPDWEVRQGGGPVFGTYPAWGGNDVIIFHTEWPEVGLARMNPDGSNLTMLVADGSATAPETAPGGRAVAYMSQAGGSWDIYRVNADGSSRVRLTDNAANDGLPAWDPEGQRIAFVSDRGGVWALWIMNLDGSGQRKIIDLPGSPDGHVGTEPDFSSRGWIEERLSWGP
jgi:hypothetical protein